MSMDNLPARLGNGQPRRSRRGEAHPLELIELAQQKSVVEVALKQIEDGTLTAMSRSEARRWADVVQTTLDVSDEVAKRLAESSRRGPLSAEYALEIAERAQRRLGRIVDDYA